MHGVAAPNFAPSVHLAPRKKKTLQWWRFSAALRRRCSAFEENDRAERLTLRSSASTVGASGPQKTHAQTAVPGQRFKSHARKLCTTPKKDLPRGDQVDPGKNRSVQEVIVLDRGLDRAGVPTRSDVVLEANL